MGHADEVMYPYTIDDSIDDPLTCSVEVTIALPEGNRWLFFATPALLSSVGDYVEGTKVRLHLGERHMIVVSEISAAIVHSVLVMLKSKGELYDRTLPLD